MRRRYGEQADRCNVETLWADVEKYVAERLKARKARATVNREIGALKQALNLARKQARLTRVPYIPMLREDNARQGFFEHADFTALVGNLADPINDIARFGYLTGWRKGEILPLRWDAVDRQAHEVRLRTSKNGQGRILPLEGDLWDLIERRWNVRTIQKKDGTAKLSEFVFQRDGHQVVEFRREWKHACKKAHLTGRIFHDFRRTAVRNMIRWRSADSGDEHQRPQDRLDVQPLQHHERSRQAGGATQDGYASGGATNEEESGRSDRDAGTGGRLSMRTRTKHGQSHQQP